MKIFRLGYSPQHIQWRRDLLRIEQVWFVSTFSLIHHLFFRSISGAVVWCCVSLLSFGGVCRCCRLVLCFGTVVWCCVSLVFGVVCPSLYMTFVVVCGGLKTFQFGVIFCAVTWTAILYARISNFFFRLQYLTSIFKAWRHFFSVLPSIRRSWLHASLRFLSYSSLFTNYSMSLCFVFLSLFRNLLMRPEYIVKAKSCPSLQEIICIANSSPFLVPVLSDMNSLIRYINVWSVLILSRHIHLTFPRWSSYLLVSHLNLGRRLEPWCFCILFWRCLPTLIVTR